MGITTQRIARALSAFVSDAQEFVMSNSLLVAFLVVLAIVVFQVTRPRLG